MKNKVFFTIFVLIECFIVWMVFYLVYPAVTSMMMWSVISGMVMVVVLSVNLLIPTSLRFLNLQNTSALIIANISSVAQFLWTLTFVFLVGDFNDSTRSLTPLYIGYLVICGISLFLIMMGRHGGNIAESGNLAVQNYGLTKDAIIGKMRSTMTLIEGLDTNPRSDLRKSFSHSIDIFRTFSASIVMAHGNEISNLIEQINTKVHSGNLPELEHEINTFNNYLKLLK